MNDEIVMTIDFEFEFAYAYSASSPPMSALHHSGNRL